MLGVSSIAPPSLLGLDSGSCGHRVAPRLRPDKGWGGRAPRAWTALLLLAGFPLAGHASAQVPPDERWRTLETQHFRVTFPAGLDSLARVAAGRAEQAHAALSATFVAPPRGRTEIVLTDHADVSNGFANVTPYREIVIFLRPPVDGFALSHFDDWLELVITHELVHVFHLEVGGGLASVLRGVFGRVPVAWPFFPQQSVPRWVVEGLGTWYESALTEGGRVRGTHQEMALRTAILEGRFEDIGQASGQSPAWPAGSRPYIYGSFFFDHLIRTYGEERVGAFVEALAGQWIPYRLNAAARRAFGVSFSRAWEEWREGFEAEVDELARGLVRRRPLTEAVRVTRGARQAYYPQVSPDGSTLLFARADGRSDAQLRSSAPDGSSQATRARTNGTSVFSWLPDGGVVFSQFRLTDPYRVRSDLHVLTPAGDVRRLTREARLDHPSAAPDGRSAVAVSFGTGTTSLVEVDLVSGDLRPLPDGDASANWAFPRVSPNGRWIAVSRWLPGAYFDVVVLDRSGRLVAEVTRSRAVDMAPAWSPDGRWLVWASDRSGIPNVVAASVDPETGRPGDVRQVTNLLTGAAFPSVDPSGSWIYFSEYNADGWDVSRVPFEPSEWTDPFPEHPRFEAHEPFVAPPEPSAVRLEPYRALRTLFPRYWQPDIREPLSASSRRVIGTAVGFNTHGRDLVGRHSFDLYAVFATGGGEMDGALSYRYAGLGNPLLGVTVDQLWDVGGPLFGEREEAVVDTLWITERERRASLSVTHRIPGFRVSASATGAAGLVWERRTLLDQSLEPTSLYRLSSPSSRLADFRASFSVSSARSHALSIGLEDGVAAFVQARRRVHLGLPDSLSGLADRDRGLDEGLGRVQAYASFSGPGFSDHVLALRVSGGAARGPGAGAFHFRVGGSAGSAEPITGFALFGGASHFFPVRGYASGDRRGRYAWSASGEYRFPLALVNRAPGLFPLHVDRLSGSLFLDGGNAWGAVGAENPRPDVLASAGVELLTDLLTFYHVPLSLRLGAAVPLREGDAAVYLRIGRAF